MASDKRRIRLGPREKDTLQRLSQHNAHILKLRGKSDHRHVIAQFRRGLSPSSVLSYSLEETKLRIRYEGSALADK